MDYIEFEESKKLKAGDELKINQRIFDLKRPSGEKADFVVKNDDYVVFQRSY